MRSIFASIFIMIFAFIALNSKEIKGINMPDNLKSGNESLTLNGAGVIKKMFFKVYVIGLYLEKTSTDETALLNQDKPYIIRMHFVRDGISADKIIEAWNTGFSKATGNKTDNIKNEIKQFNAYFEGNEVKENDVFQFDYKPGIGVRVYINGKQKGIIGGFNFRKALLCIWIGADPRDSGVKDEMLGK